MENTEDLVLEIALLRTEVRELGKLLQGLNISKPTEKFISRKELSNRLNISQAKIAKMTCEKTIPHIMLGNRYMYDYEQVLKSIEVTKKRTIRS